MGYHRSPKETHRIRYQVLSNSAKLFLTKGFTASTTREIAEQAGIHKSKLMYVFKSKEEVLAELVTYVLEAQFQWTQKMLEGVTEDPILFYATETTLQLYIAESSEQLRDLYAAAYSLPKTSDIIQHAITGKLEQIFAPYRPDLQTMDFYELEIASGGIMRNFMTRPCDLYFTMERKVPRFLETTFLVYRVPEEKIREAIAFVEQFDYPDIVQQLIDSMLESLEKQIE